MELNDTSYGGNTSGYGSGYGDGYGSGYGDGYGSGSGYGYGDGYGDGRIEYLKMFLAEYSIPNAEIVFWRSTMEGTPANGGSGTRAKVGLVEEIEGPLSICTKAALHGTTDPKKWKGDRWWIVALHHPVQVQDDKVGSLKRTFLADLGRCPF